MKGFSHDQLAKLAQSNQQFDLLWIDGGHSYSTVRSDFQAALALLAPGGTIYLDDYTQDPHLPDVKRFVDCELRTDSRFITTIHRTHIDRYRGYDYHVVSVRHKSTEIKKSWKKRVFQGLKAVVKASGLRKAPFVIKSWEMVLKWRSGYELLKTIGWVETMRRGEIVDAQGSPIPWITYSARYQLEKWLRPSDKVFEYGSGYSSLWFAKRVAEVKSVEHDSLWVTKLHASPDRNRDTIPNHHLALILPHQQATDDQLSIVDQYPFNQWEKEKNLYSNRLAWEDGYIEQPFLAYALEITKYPQAYFDVVFVDGMARRLCLWLAAQYVNPQGCIILDNADRSFYEPACQILEQAGFLRMDHFGIGPLNKDPWITAFFVRPESFLSRRAIEC
jgi:predicted O-methyltransferase YrrM